METKLDIKKIKINNIELKRCLTDATIGYKKLWSKDTGRNMAGSNSGTLLGIFPKITLFFKAFKEDEINPIISILNKPSMNITYYDPELKKEMTINCYAGDVDVPIKNKNGYKPFNVSLIANKKRGR